jgi:3-oxoacyl-[acyl-carrier-protein] synthase-3
LLNRLGLSTKTGAFDFNLGCSGYIYGLAIAKSFINTGIANSVLLIMAETYSKHIHEKDLASKTIFGDAAAATIIEKSENDHIFEFVLGTDGSGMYHLIVPNGGFRNSKQDIIDEKITEAGDVYTNNHLFMNGPEIFNFTIDAVPKAVNECLFKNCLTIEEVDYVIFHQANKFMIDYLRKKIKIPLEKFYINMMTTGNTVSATIPIALSDVIERKIVKPGQKVLLCGFGVGYSWGAVIIEI